MLVPIYRLGKNVKLDGINLQVIAIAVDIDR